MSPSEKPEPVAAPAAQSRNTRFALLAASVAIAASFGAVGGSLGVAKFGPMMTSAPAPVAPIAREHVADEMKALKDTVAQLRATTNKLSDNFAALKTSVASTLGAERQDRRGARTHREGPGRAAQDRGCRLRVDHGSHRFDRATETGCARGAGGAGRAAHHPEAAGVPGFVLRRVFDGAALIEGRDGIIEVEPGMVAPGLGRVEAIKREDGRWVVVTARGVVR